MALRRFAGGSIALMLFAAACGVARAARPSVPVVTVPLEPLGFTGVPDRYMGGAATMYSMHFVDGTHVLLTWSAHSLMPRLADATPDDDDRTVAAVLVELPSGKALARTEWRTRDRGQYLYALGGGRFLLRVRAKLTEIEPMRRLAAGQDAFKQRPFLDLNRPIGFISVSAGGDLLTVETLPKRRDRNAVVLVGDSPLDGEDGETERRAPVQIHFYRLRQGEAGNSEAGELIPLSSGVIASPALVNEPVTSEGYLIIKKEKDNTFDFDFRTHAGKRMELAAYDSSCFPQPYWVSPSEFIAFGCRGDSSKVELGGFNLRGEFGWLQTFGDTLVSPNITSSPQAGRFALERVTTTPGAFFDPDNLTADAITGQEIEVVQNYDGRVITKLQASPVQRSGQNFDFSPDGTLLGVVRAGNLEIYQLPPLTLKDRSEVAKATEAVPARSTDTILAGSSVVTDRAQAKAEGVKVGTEVSQQTAGEVVAPPTSSSPEDGNVVGDVPQQRRKPPSLFDADHPKPPN